MQPGHPQFDTADHLKIRVRRIGKNVLAHIFGRKIGKQAIRRPAEGMLAKRAVVRAVRGAKSAPLSIMPP